MQLWNGRKSENLFEPAEIARKIKQLRIYFPDFNIDECGKEFSRFEKLEELYAQAKVGSESLLPPEIGRIESLKKLTILNFDYSEFPMWILQLKKLRRLTFRGNDIRKIPEEIQQLSSLRRLRIENCCVENLPHSIGELHELRRLSLSDNRHLKRINTDSLPKNLKVLNLVMTQVNEEHLSEIKERLPSLVINKLVD